MSQVAAFDRYIDHAEQNGFGPAALMLSLDTFTKLKREIPRKRYRKRQGTRFINAYRGVPIELHDEWSWGWMLRLKDGSYLHLSEAA